MKNVSHEKHLYVCMQKKLYSNILQPYNFALLIQSADLKKALIKNNWFKLLGFFFFSHILNKDSSRTAYRVFTPVGELVSGWLRHKNTA